MTERKRPVSETPEAKAEAAEAPEAEVELRQVHSGEFLTLADGVEYQYLDNQKRGVFFRRMTDNAMTIFPPDDEALAGCEFVKPPGSVR